MKNVLDRQSDLLLDDKQVAKILGVNDKTLAVWRCTRRINIPFVKVGRCVRYWRSDIYAYLESSQVGGEK